MNMNGDYLDFMNDAVANAELDYYERANLGPLPVAGATSPVAMLLPSLDNSRQAMSRQKARMRCLRVLNQIRKRASIDTTKPLDLVDFELPEDAVIDPYSGLPLNTKWTEKGWIVYAIGENTTDDGGGIADDTDVGVGPVHLLP